MRVPKPSLAGCGAAAGWAFVACLAVAAWQTATVQVNYDGRISGLFCIGAKHVLPDWAEASTPVFRQASPAGYDGAAYWLISLDPFVQRPETFRSLDVPRVRYRRILVPLLAWALSLGHLPWTPVAYAGVILGFIGLGVYATSRIFRIHDLASAHGFWFLALPATLTSIDRMTVDVALAALIACWILLRQNGRAGGATWWLTLAACGLTRETGLAIAAAEFFEALLARQWKRCMLAASAAVPAASWYLFVAMRTPPLEAKWIGWIPFSGPALGFWKLVTQAPSTADALQQVAHLLDIVAFLGAWLGLAWYARYILPAPPWRDALTIAASIYAAMAVLLSSLDIWSEAYAFGRTLTPLWGLIAFRGLAIRSIIPAMPLILISIRTAAGWWWQVKGVVLGLL